MDVKVVLLYVEAPLLLLLLIEIISVCVLSARRRGDSGKSDKGTQSVGGSATKDESKKNTNAQTAAPEPDGYVKGADRFLDRLTVEERAEFYKTFINSSRCGLKYKVGGDNGEFFSGVFIYLSGVRYVISDSLMRKICIEYDRLRGKPVTAG